MSQRYVFARVLEPSSVRFFVSQLGQPVPAGTPNNSLSFQAYTM